MSPKSEKPSFLERAPGPAPWYWERFPTVTGESQRRFGWRYHGDSGDLPFLVTFEPQDDPGKPLLALNSYCTPFLVPPANLGIWCPEGRNLRLLAFDPEQLKPFSYLDIAGWFKSSQERIYAATEPLCELEISAVLPPGTHPLDVPAGLHTVDEVLAPVSYPAKQPGDTAYAIYAIYPQAGLVEVLPQKWFTLGKSDVGYQWITRAVRDPRTHHICGDGFRIAAFELDDSGTDIARWLTQTL